jgi:hypothetical protein
MIVRTLKPVHAPVLNKPGESVHARPGRLLRFDVLHCARERWTLIDAEGDVVQVPPGSVEKLRVTVLDRTLCPESQPGFSAAEEMDWVQCLHAGQIDEVAAGNRHHHLTVKYLLRELPKTDDVLVCCRDEQDHCDVWVELADWLVRETGHLTWPCWWNDGQEETH